MSLWCEFCRKTDHDTDKCWGQGTVAIPAHQQTPWYRTLDHNEQQKVQRQYEGLNRAGRRAFAKEAKRNRSSPPLNIQRLKG